MIQVNNSPFPPCLHPTCLYTHPRKWPILVDPGISYTFFRLTSFSNDFHCLSHELACTSMPRCIFTLLVTISFFFCSSVPLTSTCCSSFLVLIYQYASPTNIYTSLTYLNKYKVHHCVLRSHLWLTAYMKPFALFHAYFKLTATDLVHSTCGSLHTYACNHSFSLAILRTL